MIEQTDKVFQGRSIPVIGSLSIDEQIHLYKKTQELKWFIQHNRKDMVELFKVKDNTFGIYTVFLEDSTRTKESFKNAAQFLDVKLNEFHGDQSAFNKSESYADTFNMLTWLHNQIFVIRSKLEWVCEWLQRNGKAYAERNSDNVKVPPAFINAWDGQHEHPTQELLDEFTFLENNNRDTDHIHLALAGDLRHGRTTHSKADWLKIFKDVEVDLIAPDELQMPKHYIEKMKDNGYRVSSFPSISAYLANTNQKNVAPLWYFTRPQLERMGEDILKRQKELREVITFQPEHLEQIKKMGIENFKFFHPLPRHRVHQEIPQRLDKTSLNGWESQAANWYFTRLVLLSAIAGNEYVNDGFTWQSNPEIVRADDFIQHITPDEAKSKVIWEGVHPIDNGIVIDHISRGKSIEQIKNDEQKVINTLHIEWTGGEWVSESKQEPWIYKWLIFRPHGTLSPEAIRKIAAIIPWCTINVIENWRVVDKMRVKVPPTIENIDEAHCKNGNCISHPSHSEGIPSAFVREWEDTLTCEYCETEHNHKDIWK